jgi:intracellular septation protein A
MTEPRDDEPGRPAPGPYAGLAKAASGDSMRFGDLVAGVGGVLGVVESIVPSLVFLLLFEITRVLWLAVLVAVGVSVVLTVARLVRRSPPTAALGGLVGVAVSAALALITHRSETFYLPGIITNAVYGGVLLISVLVRFPLIGVAVGVVMGDASGWRADPRRRRGFTWLTLLWVLLFAVRLVVELPLYLSGSTAALGVARLITGVPLFAPVLVLSFLVVRVLHAGTRPAERHAD